MEGNPLDKAKDIINQKKEERLSKEEIDRKRREELAEDSYKEFVDLAKKYTEVKKSNEEGIPQKKDELSDKKNNLQYGQSQAATSLKNDPDTAYLFKDDSEKNKGDVDSLHKERREVFDAVFKESQDEKRDLKRKTREIPQEKNRLDREQDKIYQEVKKILSDEDIFQKVSDRVIEKHQKLENEAGDENSEASQQYKLAREARTIKATNEYIEKNKEKIRSLSQACEIVVENAIHDAQEELNTLEHSNEYQRLFADTGFDVQKEVLDKFSLLSEDLRVNLYNYDSRTFTFPEIEKIEENIMKFANEFHKLADENRNEARGQRGKWFGKEKKYEKLAEVNSERYQFLTKKVLRVLNQFTNSINYSKNKYFTDGQKMAEQVSSLIWELSHLHSRAGLDEVPSFDNDFSLIKFLKDIQNGIEMKPEHEAAGPYTNEFEEKRNQSKKEVQLLESILRSRSGN